MANVKNTNPISRPTLERESHCHPITETVFFLGITFMKTDNYLVEVTEDDLRYAIFAIIKSCNLRCRWCFENSEADHKDAPLTTEQIVSIIRKLHGLQGISISGGEASLHPDILQILAETKKACKDPHLLSNGVLLRESVLQFLASEGIRLTISVDGMEESHDFIRGNGTFNKSLESVAKAVTLGINTSIQCTLSTKNVDDILPLISLAERLGVSHLSFMRMKPLGRGDALEDETISGEHLRKTIELVHEARKNSTVSVIFKDPLDNVFDENLRQTSLDGGCVMGGCRAGMESIFIDPKGDILPCPFLRIPIGNALTEDPKQAFCSSEVLNRLRDSNNYEKCGGCENWLICRGCRAESWMRDENLFGADKGCWR